MRDLRDSAEFQRGRAGEMSAVALLQEYGCYVVPMYDFAGEDGDKAPRMAGLSRWYVLPDLDASKGGRRAWVEVKRKGRASWTRTQRRYEHGISQRLYRQYLEVEEISGTDVWLMVMEDDTGEVLMQSLERLGDPRVYDGSKMCRGGMVFWPRQRFVLFPSGKLASVVPPGRRNHLS
jgi:hypothetical protein